MNDPINELFIADVPDEELKEQKDDPLARQPSDAWSTQETTSSDLSKLPGNLLEENVTSISEARLLANRENAKLSTGPKSVAGRETVSGNSVRHGLSGSKFRVLTSESQSDFAELHENLLAAYAPIDPGESELVLSMAQALWMTRRAAARQDRCLESLDSGDPDAAKAARLELPLYLRYQATHERAYARHSAELRKLQSDRRKAELGFASQKAKEADNVRKQEVHEGRLAAIKARTDHQAMKNRFLQYEIAHRDKCELERRQQYEMWQRSEAQRREREAAEAKRRAERKSKQ